MKNIHILIVEPGKAPYEATVPHTLETMQKIVGGCIDATYPYQDPVALVCNDEGLIDGLAFNRRVGEHVEENNTGIFGTFFVCGIGQEDFCSLSPELTEKYKRLLYYPEFPVKSGDMLLFGKQEPIPQGQITRYTPAFPHKPKSRDSR